MKKRKRYKSRYTRVKFIELVGDGFNQYELICIVRNGLEFEKDSYNCRNYNSAMVQKVKEMRTNIQGNNEPDSISDILPLYSGI